MSDTSRKINNFFEFSNRADIQSVLSKIIISERQTKILEMFYIKKFSIQHIADKLFCSVDTINKELKKIRQKIETVLPL